MQWPLLGMNGGPAPTSLRFRGLGFRLSFFVKPLVTLSFATGDTMKLGITFQQFGDMVFLKKGVLIITYNYYSGGLTICIVLQRFAGFRS